METKRLSNDVLIDEDGAFHRPRISPDGRWVTLGRRGSNPSVWVYDVSRTTLSRLAHGFVNNFPIWTPDGRRVTFFSSADGRIPGNIFWQTADGSRPADQLLPRDYTANLLSPVSWSPDGKTLAFEQHRTETQYDIMLLSLEGDRTVTPFLQSEFNEGGPIFSSDGRWMAYASDESGRLCMCGPFRPRAGSGWSPRTEVTGPGGILMGESFSTGTATS